jgi:hypothetical protein
VAGKRAPKKPPRDVQDTVTATRPSEFDRLVRFIRTFQGRFALAFIRGDDRRQRDGVLASLTDVLREQSIVLRQIDLTFQEVPDLLGTLKAQCDTSRNTAVVITGIEASLQGPLLALMNIQRDLLSQTIRCPILFWVSSFALNLIAREAPDLYDFRSTVFRFESPRGTDADMPQSISSQIAPLVSELQEDDEERLASPHTQLERYQQNESRLSVRDQLVYGELLEEVARSYKDTRHRTEALVVFQFNI